MESEAELFARLREEGEKQVKKVQKQVRFGFFFFWGGESDIVGSFCLDILDYWFGTSVFVFFCVFNVTSKRHGS